MFEFDHKVMFNEGKIDLLTFGETLVDLIAKEYGDQCSSFERYFGGSPANIAMNAKRLGINTRLVTAVGNDSLGTFIKEQIEKNGIDTAGIRSVENSTSLVLVSKSTGTPVPIFYRDADYNIEYDEAIESMLKNTKILHFSCWPLSRSPARATLEKAISVVKNKNGVICFDPNYHRLLWEKGEDGVSIVKSLIKSVDIIKPSEDDAERIFGADIPEAQIEKFHKLGAKLVIMTLGKQGALVSNGIAMMKFNTMATEIVDTTGAGDAFWSGFYASLIKGCDVTTSLRTGLAASAYKLRHAGAVVFFPTVEELQKIYKI